MMCATMMLLSHISDVSQLFLKMGFYDIKMILKVGFCDILLWPRIPYISLSVKLMYLLCNIQFMSFVFHELNNFLKV